MYSRQSIFTDTAENFNDWDKKSGGLVSSHVELEGIIPDQMNKSGFITSEQVYIYIYMLGT